MMFPSSSAKAIPAEPPEFDAELTNRSGGQSSYDGNSRQRNRYFDRSKKNHVASAPSNHGDQAEFELTSKIIDLLADKWTPAIMLILAADFGTGFNQINRNIPQVSRKRLADSLDRLEESGLIRRVKSTSDSDDINYYISGNGLKFLEILKFMSGWASRNKHFLNEFLRVKN